MIQFHQFWDVYLETWGSCLTKQWLHDPIVDVIWTKLIMSSRRDVATGMMGIGFGESPPLMAAGWSYFQATVVNDYQSYCQLFSQIDGILRSGCQQSNTTYFEIFWTLLRLDHDGSVTISRGKMPAPSGNQTWQACTSSILWFTYWKWWSSIANLVYSSLLSVDFGSVPCDDAFVLLHLGRLEARRKKKFLRSITDWGATRSCYHENVILLNLVAGPAPVRYQGSLAVILR